MPVLARYYRARSGKVHRVDFTRQAIACGAGHRDMTALESLTPCRRPGSTFPASPPTTTAILRRLGPAGLPGVSLGVVVYR